MAYTGDPVEMIKFIALGELPPLHPPLPASHLTRYCSAKSTVLAACEVRINSLSKNPSAANAQQLPQPPWFLTDETIPLFLQSRVVAVTLGGSVEDPD